MPNLTRTDQWAQSNPIAGVSGQSVNLFRLDFLDALLAQMESPRIAGMGIRITGTVVTDAAGGSGGREELFAGILSRLRVADRFGDIVDVDGYSLRLANYGLNPNSSLIHRALSNNANESFDILIPVPVVNPECAKRGDDFLMDARLLRGGQVQIDFASFVIGPAVANQITVSNVNAYLVCWLRDVPGGEVPSRLCLRQQAVIAAQQPFSLASNSRLAAAWYYAGAVAERAASITAFSAQNFSVRALNYPTVPLSAFYQWYQIDTGAWRAPASSATETSLDPVYRGVAVPLYMPDAEMSIFRLPIVDTFDFYTDGTVTTSNLPKLVTVTVEPRPDGQVTAGTFVGANGMTRGYGALQQSNPILASQLPIKQGA